MSVLSSGRSRRRRPLQRVGDVALLVAIVAVVVGALTGGLIAALVMLAFVLGAVRP